MILLPLATLAQGTQQEPITSQICPGGTANVKELLNFFTCLLLDSVVPLLMALAVVVFIYGVIQYMINANDSAKREEGRNFMIWGIVALFVITSIWGLVKLLAGTFGIGFALPQLQQ